MAISTPRLTLSENRIRDAGLGTSGTFMGTTRRLKEHNPLVQAISMQPDSPFHGLEGLKHMATSIVPAIYDANLADRQVTVETETAYAMAKRLAREEGLLVGISAAAAVAASLEIARGRRRTDVALSSSRCCRMRRTNT